MSNSLIFPLLVKVSACEPALDRVTSKPTGSFNIKVWLDELVSSGDETVTNKQLQTFVSPVELVKGADYLLSVELDCDAVAKVTREGKPYLTNKTVRIKRVHTYKRLGQPTASKGV